jgi:hypothetical protein
MSGMKKILMLLTSHRLDCLKLTVDLLKHTGSLEKFDRVVFLLNGVVGRHKAYVETLMAGMPGVRWDTISGPRGKGKRVATLQNECVRRYPESLYFKIDEDLFVSEGWVEKLTDAYEVHRRDENLALITPLIPNSGLGCHYLLTAMPDLADEYRARFPHPIVPDADGPVWIYPELGEWITRKFLNAGGAMRDLAAKNLPRLVKFAYRFSINCIVYDYRHWTQLGGIPDDEELAWGQWVPDHGKFDVLVTDCLAHHYSFFVQQDWLDRTHLLEDLRRANLTGSAEKTLAAYHVPRWLRIARQLPRVARRRLGLGT